MVTLEAPAPEAPALAAPASFLRSTGEDRTEWFQEDEHRLDRSAGWAAAAWIEANCRLTSAKWAGDPFRLLPWQVRFLVEMLELDADGRRRYRWAYLSVGKKNGKTELAAALALWLAIAAPEAGLADPSPRIVMAAGNDDQADLCFTAARTMVERGPLADVVEVYESELVIPSLDARISRVSAAARKQSSNLDGKNVSAVIADELHVFEGNRGELVWGTLARGTGAREQPLVLAITTAGFDRSSVCYRQYERAKAAILEPDSDPAFYAMICEAPDGAELTASTFLAANPSCPAIVDPGFYVEQLKAMHEHDVRRYFLNQWVTVEDESWLAERPGAWAACEGEPLIVANHPTFVGVDVALRRDTTAVVVVQEHDDLFHVVSKVWAPDDGKIDHLAIINHVRKLHDDLEVREVVYDPRFFEVPALMLIEESVPMVELPQHPSRMMPVCAAGYDLINQGRIIHNGDQVLADHVLSAVRREYPEGWTLSKGRSRRHIDACIAMLLALHRAQTSNPADWAPRPTPKVFTL